MGPKLNSLSPVDRNSTMEDYGGGWDDGWRLGSAQIRDKRPHIPHSRSQGDLPDYTQRRKAPWRSKREGAPPHSK